MTLPALTAIGGYLNIYDNFQGATGLSSLNGLSALQTIGGYLSINNNGLPLSAGISGMNALTRPWAATSPSRTTPCLTSITGFSGLGTVASGGLRIDNNAALTTVGGFAGLTGVTSGGAGPGNLQIYTNPLLKTITGFGDLDGDRRHARDPRQRGAHLKFDSAAFATLGSVGSSILIYNNAALTGIGGLPALATANSDVQIHDNAVMSTIGGFAALTDINGSLNIANNVGLVTTVAGFGTLGQVNGSLTIRDSDKLTNFNGLKSLDLHRLEPRRRVESGAEQHWHLRVLRSGHAPRAAPSATTTTSRATRRSRRVRCWRSAPGSASPSRAGWTRAARTTAARRVT